MATDLPDLPAGVYRHYKGHFYQVFGYGHDANADTLGDTAAPDLDGEVHPLGERPVVVYMGLQLDGAHTGPRLAVRTADDFHAWVHPEDGAACPTHVGDTNTFCSCNPATMAVKRFAYVGPMWDGDGG